MKEKDFETLCTIISIAVGAAEQLFPSDAREQKREYVNEYLMSRGYTIDATVNNAIEAEVLNLHAALYGAERDVTEAK